jgi:hypothetical protein
VQSEIRRNDGCDDQGMQNVKIEAFPNRHKEERVEVMETLDNEDPEGTFEEVAVRERSSGMT